jgi:NTP pyrophosphatase (non-canonical NTP hydrolase)
MEWAKSTFPNSASNEDPQVRVFIFLEEAIELAQAVGICEEKVFEQVRHVYDKPIGDIDQEMGGTMATLMMAAESLSLDAGLECEKELESAWKRQTQIQAKSKTKVKL